MLKKVFFVLVLFVMACGDGKVKQRGTSVKKKPKVNRIGVGILLAQNKTMTCDWTRIFDGHESLRLGILWRSGGNANRCLRRLLKDDRLKDITVYLSNGSCIFKGICSDREAITHEEVIKNAHKTVQFFEKYCKNCTIKLFIRLEDRLSAQEACQLSQRVRESVPEKYQIWRNPVDEENLGNPADCFDGIELHGSGRSTLGSFGIPCQWSNDGADLLVGNTVWDLPHRMSVPEFKRQATEVVPGCGVLAWAADGNCLATDTTMAELPHERFCGPLDPKTIDDLNLLLTQLNELENNHVK